MSKKPIRVNLVEHPGWEPWAVGGTLDEQAMDLAWESLTANISEGNCESLIMDLAGPLREKSRQKQDRSSKSISWDDAAAICVGLRDAPPELEITRQTILDAYTGAYEEALRPSDEDIQGAIDDTIEMMADHYELDEEFWAPLIDQGVEPEQIIEGLFEERAGGVFVDRQVTYVRKPGHYDRELVFDFWKSNVVKRLLKSIPDDWDLGATLAALENDFRPMIEGFIRRFFIVLKKGMDHIQVENRMEWRKHWKALLQQDLTAVQEEMLAYSVNHPSKPEED